MNINGDKDKLQKTRILNTHYVMVALEFLKEATENELYEVLINRCGQPAELVKEEIEKILRKGTGNGFLVKKGNVYSLPNNHQDDVDTGNPKTSGKPFNPTLKQPRKSEKKMAANRKAAANTAKKNAEKAFRDCINNCIIAAQRNYPGLDFQEILRTFFQSSEHYGALLESTTQSPNSKRKK